MKWYKLYLEAQIRGATSTAYAYTDPMCLRALVVLALARRDAAANLLRSREEFYAGLRRLSSTGAESMTITISRVDCARAIPTIRTLRELSLEKLVSFSSGLRECKDIYDLVRDGTPYTFKVKSGNKAAILAKLRAAGATVE